MKKNTNSKLKNARISLGFTLKQVSRLLGICYPTLSAYEGGTSVPSPEVFSKLQRILHLKEPYEAYFDHPKCPRRKKIYGEGSRCTIPGCDRIPAAKGMCMSHYVKLWKARIKQEQARLLYLTQQRLAEYERQEKKGGL